MMSTAAFKPVQNETLDLLKFCTCELFYDRYKRKFVAVWNKLCELKGVANLTGRPIEKAVKFEGELMR